MKFLLTSDIHSHSAWLEWIGRSAHQFDLVVIAGDVLDSFSSIPAKAQIQRFMEWSRNFRSDSNNPPLAICSGNHDSPYHVFEGTPWFQLLRKYATLDRQLLRLEGWLVSCHPYGVDTPDWRSTSRVARGNELRWLAIHHEPPAFTLIGNDTCSSNVRTEIELYQPDLVACGHIHEAPTEPRGSFMDRLGKSIVLNAGQTSDELQPAPNHLILDTLGNTLSWHSESRPPIEVSLF